MKLPLVALTLLLGVSMCLASLPTAETDNELQSNKTPKSAHLFTDACTECQQVDYGTGEPNWARVFEIPELLNFPKPPPALSPTH